MSDSWEASKTSWRRLRASWQQADFDHRFDASVHAAGLMMMATAVCLEFGWHGAFFCLGILCWRITK